MAGKKPTVPTKECMTCERELPLTEFASCDQPDGSKRYDLECDYCSSRGDGNMFDSYMPRSGPSQDPSYM